MANKRIKELAEKSTLASGDYLPIDNENGTKKVNASRIMTPLSSAQTDATRALNMIRSTSSFPTGDAYSSSSSYKVGDMVINNNTLYRCKTACSAASWTVNANNFEAISLASAITDLNKHSFGTSQSLTKGTTFTCPSDGYIRLQCPSPKTSIAYVSINGIEKFLRLASEDGYGSGMGDAFSEVVFVRKGTTVLFESASSANATCIFYPLT